jgi:DNA ligase-1
LTYRSLIVTLLADIVATSERVAQTSRRNAKIEELAACLCRLAPDEIETAVAFLAGETRQGRIGIGYALLRAAYPDAHAETATLTLAEIDEALTRIAASAGPGSAAERTRILRQLQERATAGESDFLERLLQGELRQGALKGLMQDAVAQAASLPSAVIRQRAMLAGGVAAVARTALTEGVTGLERFSLRLMQPVAPMLAQPADDVGEALSMLGTAAFEWKLDGARVQVHKDGDDVHVFTRNLNDVTASAPEIVEALREVAAHDLILDGEAIALQHDGAPQPFQVTMRRFGRTLDVASMRASLPLSVFFFDCLRRDGESLVERPLEERASALSQALPADLIVPRLVTADTAAAQQFFDDALARGHEGVMAKSLTAPYDAGSRGASWLKIKRTHTLDLVVLAAEWGHGRRKGWLSNLHLGARDPVQGGYVMLGKTFKGMTDEMLAWQTTELLARAVERNDWVVAVRPDLVVEIAFNDLQASPRYPGKLALRFARVKRYRPDKSADEADTIETVRAIYAGQMARVSDVQTSKDPGPSL